MADVKISQETFYALYRYHVENQTTDQETDMIKRELEQKKNAIERRKWYKIMQDRSLPPDVRDHARQMYADLSGIPADYQYPPGSLDPD